MNMDRSFQNLTNQGHWFSNRCSQKKRSMESTWWAVGTTWVVGCCQPCWLFSPPFSRPACVIATNTWFCLLARVCNSDAHGRVIYVANICQLARLELRLIYETGLRKVPELRLILALVSNFFVSSLIFGVGWRYKKTKTGPKIGFWDLRTLRLELPLIPPLIELGKEAPLDSVISNGRGKTLNKMWNPRWLDHRSHEDNGSLL